MGLRGEKTTAEHWKKGLLVWVLQWVLTWVIFESFVTCNNSCSAKGTEYIFKSLKMFGLYLGYSIFFFFSYYCRTAGLLEPLLLLNQPHIWSSKNNPTWQQVFCTGVSTCAQISLYLCSRESWLLFCTLLQLLLKVKSELKFYIAIKSN